MKKKKVKNLSLNKKVISKLHCNSITGGETCEGTCQGGTGCRAGGDSIAKPCITQNGGLSCIGGETGDNILFLFLTLC